MKKNKLVWSSPWDGSSYGGSWSFHGSHGELARDEGEGGRRRGRGVADLGLHGEREGCMGVAALGRATGHLLCCVLSVPLLQLAACVLLLREKKKTAGRRREEREEKEEEKERKRKRKRKRKK
jgi:hypothetical protein